jgi:hypothetical protein
LLLGNLSTEKLIDYLHSKGYNTGINIDVLKKIKIINRDKIILGESGVGC